MLFTIFSLAILVLSIVIHEVSHGIAALWQGDPTAKYAGRLTLNPISHVDVLGSIIVPMLCLILPGSLMFGWAKPVPFNPYNLKNKKWGEAIVAIAGPLSNLIVALIIGLFLRFGAEFINSGLAALLSVSVLINLMLAVFNLVPLPPLDGSKILFALFPEKMANFMRINQQYGFVLTFIFIIAFVQFIDPVVYGLYSLIVG